MTKEVTCEKCNAKNLLPDEACCGKWKCTNCGAENLLEITEASEDDNWLECIPWTGNEKDLPLGEWTSIPNFRAVDLVRRWEVLDVEEDAGFREVKKAELKPDDVIIGAIINENSFNKLVENYGKRFFLAKHASSMAQYDRWEWKKAFGTDVLELESLKQIRSGTKPFKVGR